jgi:hypothetical protein
MKRNETELAPATKGNRTDELRLSETQTNRCSIIASSRSLVAISSPGNALEIAYGKTSGGGHLSPPKRRLSPLAINAAHFARSFGVSCALFESCCEFMEQAFTPSASDGLKGNPVETAVLLDMLAGRANEIDSPNRPIIGFGELRGIPHALALCNAELAVIGPIEAVNAARLSLHNSITSHESLNVLIPHPVLLKAISVFASVAAKFQFVCLSKSEAKLLDRTTDDIDELALRVRQILGDGEVPFALTDNENAGWLWDEQDGRYSWFPIKPLTDAAGRDALCLSYSCFRHLFGEAPSIALSRALSMDGAR